MWCSSCKKHWYKHIVSVILSSFEQELSYIGAHSPFHSSYWPLLLLLLPVNGGISVQVSYCVPHLSPFCLHCLCTFLHFVMIDSVSNARGHIVNQRNSWHHPACCTTYPTALFFHLSSAHSNMVWSTASCVMLVHLFCASFFLCVSLAGFCR
jgi:hypothetical protein